MKRLGIEHTIYVPEKFDIKALLTELSTIAGGVSVTQSKGYWQGQPETTNIVSVRGIEFDYPMRAKIIMTMDNFAHSMLAHGEKSVMRIDGLGDKAILIEAGDKKRV